MNSEPLQFKGRERYFTKCKIVFSLCCVAIVSFFFIDRFRDSYCVVTDGDAYFVQHKYGIIGNYIHLQAYPDYQSAKDSIGVVWNPKPKTYTEVTEPVTNCSVALSVKSIEDLYLCKATNLPAITNHLPVAKSDIRPISYTNLTNVDVRFTTNNCEAEAFNRIRMDVTTNDIVLTYNVLWSEPPIEIEVNEDRQPNTLKLNPMTDDEIIYRFKTATNGVVSLERITE